MHESADRSTHAASGAGDTDADRGRSRQQQVLAFDAPYLIEKLSSSGIAADETEARALFDEVKKYLLLAALPGKTLPMTSVLVDAAWHQFVLFTREYSEFCATQLGTFVHHVPSLPSAHGSEGPTASREEFAARYAQRFGALPDVWYDSRCLRPSTRLRRRQAGPARLAVEHDASRAQLVRLEPTRQLLCTTELRAQAALEFIALHACFLARELPGLRGFADQLALLQPLVRYDILRISV